ncbi:MAG TPA: protein-L-isoaspartate(D-aspartate) O-methyltransferase [Kofleriaceae bacterium]|nr:protein-L-isoaspartate(D-aspartate) O-methyltransferase [Kofleriaceae bacterium]
MSERADERARMVAEQIEARGVHDPDVLRAMREVPRHLFVPPALAAEAYADRALPVEDDQTISQPYIVALMAEALDLERGSRVLEIGTGTGYAAAVLAALGAEVYTIEIREALAASAAARLASLGVAHVHVRCGDGALGWDEMAPFDGIAVAASGPDVPPALVEQLAVGAHLVLPIGPQSGVQQLVRITRRAQGTTRERLGGVMFVPLVHATYN